MIQKKTREEEEYDNTFIFKVEKLINTCSILKTEILKLFSVICFRALNAMAKDYLKDKRAEEVKTEK